MRGHTDPDTGGIYSVNTMLHVTDEIRGVDEPMWVASRKLMFSPEAGATTELKLWRPGSFQIDTRE
jgi:prophage tail gpP-like protein